MINIKSAITSARWTWFVRATTRIFNHTKHLTKHELILSASLPRLPLSCASLLLIKWLDELTIPSLSLLPHLTLALLCLRSDLLVLSNHLCLPILLTGLLNLAEQTLIRVRCLGCEWTKIGANIVRSGKSGIMWLASKKMLIAGKSGTQSIVSILIGFSYNKVIGYGLDSQWLGRRIGIVGGLNMISVPSL